LLDKQLRKVIKIMFKKFLPVLLALLLIGTVGVSLNSRNNTKKAAEHAAMMKKEEADKMTKTKTDEAMAMEKTKTAEAEAMAKEKAMAAGETTTPTTTPAAETAMAKHGNYVTLADYNKDSAKYADTKKVYFFHASWCPVCQGIQKEIDADMTRIPAGVTMIKTDYDSNTDLRQKFGVTYQYTFVQVDTNGNKTDKWSATSLADALAGIKS
jgi:thioredoxin 1